MVKNNYFFQKICIIIMVILFLLNIINCEDTENTYNKTLGDKCSSNLECNSACCSSDKCSKTSKCEKLVTTVYIAEAALCLVFIIAFTIYLVIKLKKIKKDFQNKTASEEEQNSHKEN